GGGGATRTGAPGSGAQGLVIVSWSCSVSLTSASGTNAQSVCSGTAIVPITYQFSGVTGATVSGLPAGVTGSFNSANNVFTISGTPTVAGTFNYTITPVGGCSTTTATGSITVSSPAVSVGPVLSAICQGGSTPALGGSVSGGASGGTWSDGGVGGAFNPTATNLNATYTPPPGFTGTVTLTLTSSGGCRVVTGSKTLVVNPNPSAAISYQGSPFCNSVTSAAVTLTGTTGGTFSSSPVGLSLNATSGQINPSSSTTGSYTVTYNVTGSGCSFSTITTVVVDAAPQLACSSSNPINCVSSTSVLSSGATAVSGATITSYSWSPGGGTSSSITVSDGINYSVTVTQSNGCTSSCSVSAVMDTCKPTVSVSSSGGGGACSGTPTTLSAAPVVCSSNTVSYSWSNGSTQSAISTSVAGTYSVTVTQNPNGCTASASGTVVASGSPVAVSVSASPIPCFGGTTSVAVSATGGTPPYSGTGSFVITAGTYSYIVTDAVGCTGSAAITVANPAVLNASATVTSTIVCFGGTGTVAVTASGGTAPYSGTGTLAMVAGTRTFTVTDSRGCSATTNSITLTQPTQLLLTTNTTPTNCGAFIGSASAVASGGVSPYSYVWSDGQSGSSAVNLGGGTYVVTVTDAIGCSTTATASIAVNGGTPLGLTGPIIGPAGACLKSTVTYSVDPVSGAGAYTWTLPFGVSGLSSANSITVNFDSTYAGGSICVTPSNTCATGNTSCINIPAITVRPSTP
ncbi:MAG: beta strand repeat-containing protein, partial [Bacteroidota bacterium]